MNKGNHMTDIFDITNISDLSDEVKLSLSRKKLAHGNIVRGKVYELLRTANSPVSIDQIICAYARSGYGSLRRQALYGHLVFLVKECGVNRLDRGIYEYEASYK
jgi:hypothetical protein